MRRGQITTHVVDYLNELPHNYPIGDSEPPREPHGWQGEPNSGGTNFIPWLTLSAGNANNSSGPIAASQADWKLIYFLTTAGVTRQQTEAVADTSREHMVVLERSLIPAGSSNWKVQQVRVTNIGGVTRIGQISPSYYVQTDTYEIWLSKEL